MNFLEGFSFINDEGQQETCAIHACTALQKLIYLKVIYVFTLNNVFMSCFIPNVKTAHNMSNFLSIQSAVLNQHAAPLPDRQLVVLNQRRHHVAMSSH